MKQNFTLSTDQSKLFIKYFNAAMRDPELGLMRSNGSGRFENGKYINEIAVDFHYNDKKIFVVWKIIFNSDGSLISIENLNADDSSQEYELLLSQFINDILQNVLNKNKKTFFKRTHYSIISGSNLIGEFWLPGFRFAPLFPEDDSKIIYAERFVVIDQNIEAIDNEHANEVASGSASIYSAILSFILDIGIELPTHQELYFLNKDNGNYFMERKSTQLIDPNNIDRLPSKGEICPLGSYDGSVFDKYRPVGSILVCPKETRKIIRGMTSATEFKKEAFFRSCLLYQLAVNIGRKYPTVKLSYETAAVETIVKSNLSEYKSFTDFMTKYAGENRSLYDLIYSKIRSAHWHSGIFTLGEYDFNRDFIGNSDGLIKFNIIDQSHQLLRKAILNWVNEEINFIE